MRSYSASEVSRLTGAGVPLIKRWADTGLLVPDLGGGGAKGKHRQYSFRNVFEIAVAWELQKLQLPAATMKRLLAVLRFASQLHGPDAFSDPARWIAAIAWRRCLTDVENRPSPWNAALVYVPGELPEIVIAGPEDRQATILFSARSGQASLIVPIWALLRRLELETGDRWPSDADLQAIGGAQ